MSVSRRPYRSSARRPGERRERRRKALTGVSLGGLALAAAGPVMADPADGPANIVTGVVVTARKPQVTALSKTIQDTPQAINVLPQELLESQGVASLQEALKNVPGVTLNAGEGGSHGDSINLRGFPASDDFFLDGLRDTGFYTRDSFNDEAIEVYKGPASTLFGRGSTGGVVNQVSKTPFDGSLLTSTITGGSNEEGRITVDINEKASDDIAVRLNVMDQNASQAGRDFVKNDRWGFAPSVAFGLHAPTKFTLSYLHQEEHNMPDYGIPFLGASPAPVSRSTWYGLLKDDVAKTRVDVVSGRFKQELTDDLTFTDEARYGRYVFDTRQTAPHWGATAPVAHADPATLVVFRDRPSVAGLVETEMNESQLNYRSHWRDVASTLVVGLELDRETATLDRFANQMNAIAPTPLLDPDPFEDFPGHQTAITQTPVTRTETVSGFIGDTVDIGKSWTVMAGFRYDRFNARHDEPIINKHFAHSDDIGSPRAAVIYKPTTDLSFYVSYGTSYDPSAENLSLSARTADLAPEKDHTFEAGGKYTWNGRLALAASVFNTEMTNARVGDPTNPSLQILAGDLRVNGLELTAQGHLTDHWEILAGYTYLDAKTVKSSDPTQVGKRVANTAPNQANLWTIYEFSEDWKIGGGLNWLDRRAADVSGVATVPGYVTLDAMASYRVNRHLEFQLNGYNLTDKFNFTNAYYSSPTENHVLPGPGRTVLLSAKFTY